MKNQFFEYYSPSKKELKEIWDNCIFSYDANVLLNLYRYTDKTRENFVKVLKQIQKKSFLTHQAGYEYHKNRLNTISSQKSSYDKLIKYFDSKTNEVKNELNKYKKHSYIQINDILDKIDKTFSDIIKDIESLKNNHPDLLKTDEIKDILSDLFIDNVTEPFDDNTLAKIYTEGRDRYDKAIPPGYKDLAEKKNNEPQSLYGDLILWKQVIKHAKQEKKPVILVTDDLKEDWWYKFQGKTISPRPELLKEFYSCTKQKILIYNADSFLTFANKQINAKVDENTLKEIKNLRLTDENNIYTKNNFLYDNNLKNIDIFNSFQSKHLPNDKQFYNNFITSIVNMKKFTEQWNNMSENEQKLLRKLILIYQENKKVSENNNEDKKE